MISSVTSLLTRFYKFLAKKPKSPKSNAWDYEAELADRRSTRPEPLQIWKKDEFIEKKMSVTSSREVSLCRSFLESQEILRNLM
jgi:hypothetical protein